eukprot:9625489-Heterocapsa_arctica.AAC.1
MKGNIYVDGACYPHQTLTCAGQAGLLCKRGRGMSPRFFLARFGTPCHKQPRLQNGSLGQ